MYDASQFIFSKSDDKKLEDVIFGAQIAKQSQRKYQNSMNGNPISGQAQDAEIGQVGEDKIIEGHVAHWQELKNQGRVQQWQEQKAIKSLHNSEHSTNSV